MKVTIVSVLLLFLIFGCDLAKEKDVAVSDPDREKLGRVCDSIIVKLSEEQDSLAMELFKANTVISNEVVDTLRATYVSHRKGLMASYGNPVGSDFIVERCVKDFLCKRFYVMRFESYYLKVDFNLFKTSSGWKITGFNYNDELTEILY